jgi:hypothetical protein
MVDIDSVEVCHRCYKPLVLLEVGVWVEQTFKPYYAIRELAKLCNRPAYIALYEKIAEDDFHGAIGDFHMKMVYPTVGDKYIKISSGDYAKWLLKLHGECLGCGHNNKKTS